MTNKRTWFFAIVLLLSLGSCQVYKDVEVKEVLDVQIIEFNEQGAECEIILTVLNPNGYKVTLTESHVDLFFEGKPLGEVQLLEKIVIPKKSQSTIKLKCEAGVENIQLIAGDLFALLFKTEFQLEGKGYIRGKALMISKKVPLEFKEAVAREDLGF